MMRDSKRGVVYDSLNKVGTSTLPCFVVVGEKPSVLRDRGLGSPRRRGVKGRASEIGKARESVPELL